MPVLARPLSGSALALCLSLVACASDPKPADSAPPPPPQCPPGQTFDGQACVAPSPMPTQSTMPPDSPPPPAPSGPSATPSPPETAEAVTALLSPLASQHAAPGASPLGEPLAGTFAEGQSLETVVQMQPGKCYTVVAVALPTITNLDVRLSPQVPFPGLITPVVAQDQTAGPMAIVGTRPNCFKWALPVSGPMKITVTAAQGQGMAAAQIYEQ